MSLTSDQLYVRLGGLRQLNGTRSAVLGIAGGVGISRSREMAFIDRETHDHEI